MDPDFWDLKALIQSIGKNECNERQKTDYLNDIYQLANERISILFLCEARFCGIHGTRPMFINCHWTEKGRKERERNACRLVCGIFWPSWRTNGKSAKMVDIRFIETHGLFTYEMSEISSNLMLQVFWENDGNHSNGIKNIINFRRKWWENSCNS